MNASNNNSIDLYSLAKTLWRAKWTVAWITGAFVLLGLLIAFTSPRVYTASTVMVPQIQSKSSNLGGLSGLAAMAGMAGINLSSLSGTTEDLSPLIYPEIVRSYSFQKEIMYTPLNWAAVDHPVSLVEYGQTHHRGSILGRMARGIARFPGTVASWFRKDLQVPSLPGDSLIRMSEAEKEIWDDLSKSLLLNVDKKNGYITLSASGPEPLVTAQIADKAQKLMQSRITEFRIEKARQNLEFIQGRFNDKKKEFETAQDRLARFLDGNQGSSTNRLKAEENRLQSEYNLAFTVYSELAKQLENAKISVKEDTPVFSIIQSVIVPVKPSKPRKIMILTVCLLLGLAIGSGYVFARKNWMAVS